MLFYLFFFLFSQLEYPYEILRDSIYEVYFEDGTSKRFEEAYVKILTEEGGKELKSLSIDYSPQYNRARFELIEIIHPDGKRDTIRLEDVKNIPAPPELGGTIFWGDRRLIVEIPKLTPGDIVHEITIKRGGNWLGPTGNFEKLKTPYPGYFNTIELFEDEVPIIHKVYVLRENPKKPIKFGIFNGEIKYKREVIDGIVYHVFYIDSVGGAPRERLSGSRYDRFRKLIVTNIEDFKAISIHDYELAEPNVKPDSFIFAFVDSILKGTEEDRERIERLFRFVADHIRYLGLIESETEGYEPHKASLTLKEREGVCKDKAGLLVALLRAAGFKAYYATTAVGMRIEKIPADQTNHAIVALELNPFEYIYLDPTIGARGKEFLPPSEEGQGVIVARREGDILREIPLSPPDSNGFEVDITERIAGDSSVVLLKMKAKRGFDRYTRLMFSGRSYREIVKELSGNISKKGEIKIDTIIYKDPSDYSDYYSFTVRFVRHKVLKKLRNFVIFRPYALLEDVGLWEFDYITPGKRRYPIRFSMTKKIDVREKVVLDKKYIVYAMPEEVELTLSKNPYETSLKTYSKQDSVGFSVRIGNKVFEPSEYRKLVEMKRKLEKFKDQWLILEVRE